MHLRIPPGHAGGGGHGEEDLFLFARRLSANVKIETVQQSPTIQI